MARFDLYTAEVGYFVDVQTDLLDGLTTRLMVPLLPAATAPRPGRRLNPVLLLDGAPYALQPQLMGAVLERQLGRPIDNLMRYYDEITDAVDMILKGF